MADGEPGWLGSLDRSGVAWRSHDGAAAGLASGRLLALAALACSCRGC